MNRARIISVLLYGLLVAILLTGLPEKGHAGEEIVLVTYGDSLSAGFGLREKDAFPAQLEAALNKRGHKVRVVNASVSGDTTAAGLKRFDWSFPKNADGAILELGANDAMRGLKPENARANLDEILMRMKAKGVEALLTGMLAPRNLGVEYTTAFDRIYRELAKMHGVLLYPFFLFDVVGKRDLSLDDGLHPTAKALRESSSRSYPWWKSSSSVSPRTAPRLNRRSCKPMPRLFSGLEIPGEIAERLAMLKGGLEGARWVEPENHHITLRFIGDVDGDTAMRISDALGRIEADAFSLNLDGVGSFGRGKPRAVWAGVAPSEPLASLHRAHEQAALTAGLEPEPRNFHAHVTLARMRKCKASDVAKYLEYNGAFLSPGFAVTRFVLFSARESRGGGPYVVEHAYALNEPRE